LEFPRNWGYLNKRQIKTQCYHNIFKLIGFKEEKAVCVAGCSGEMEVIMDSILENVGILAIAFMIIYGYIKINEYYYLKRLSFYEDEKVYKAAEEFVSETPSDDVKVILANCCDFDEKNAEEILSRSISHRTDKDGGYRAFIRSVNKVLGEDVYSERRYTH